MDLVRKIEGNRLLGRSTRRSEDNIKMDLREIEWGIVDWINLSRDRGQCLTCEDQKTLLQGFRWLLCFWLVIPIYSSAFQVFFLLGCFQPNVSLCLTQTSLTKIRNKAINSRAYHMASTSEFSCA
jgi:hypothetical protein